jgi:hypothetical protein
MDAAGYNDNIISYPKIPMMKTCMKFVPVSALVLLISSSCNKGLTDHSDKLSSDELNKAISAAAVTTRIEAENYTAMSGIQTEPCREGTKDVGWINKGDWMDYTVDVATTGPQTISFRTAGPQGSLQVQKPDGTVLANVSMSGTTSGQVYQTTSTQIKLTAGKQTLRIYATSDYWNFNWFELGNNGTPPAVITDTVAATAPVQPNSANVTLYTNFEDASSFNGWSLEICRASALTISKEVTPRKGNGEARFEFAKSDVTNYNGYVRAEMHRESPAEAENWYAFSSYLPTDFVDDPMAENIAQWHEIPDWDLGENWRSPPIALGIVNGRYYIKYMWAAAPVNTNDTKDGEKQVDLGPVDKGKWNDFAFHIKFSYKSDGILEIYKNKVKIFSLYGPNSYNDENYPYFKVGIYKWGWNGWASYSPEDKRVLYVDEVRVGNKNANLNDVSPN